MLGSQWSVEIMAQTVDSSIAFVHILTFFALYTLVNMTHKIHKKLTYRCESTPST
jgi:uncharacterized membrane protein